MPSFQFPVSNFNFTPVGVIHSCFTEKFGIPRQPGLVSEARARLELIAPYNQSEAIKGLEAYSHIWVVFVFHGNLNGRWKTTVRPPRLGGNRRVGVFASRAPFRPNPIGLSVVAMTGINDNADGIWLEIAGGDFLDQTPVLDIKPYLPGIDRLSDARAGLMPERDATALKVVFSEQARSDLAGLPPAEQTHLEKLIVQMLQLDPRPGYFDTKPNKNRFGFQIYDWDVKWEFIDGVMHVKTIRAIENSD